jgi:hypothetical protein
MLIFGSHMHKFSVSKDMKKINNDKKEKGHGSREGGGAFIKGLKFSVEHDRVVTTLNTIKH